MHFLQSECAKQTFIFYIAQDLDQLIKIDVQQLVSELSTARNWSVSPPNYIENIDEGGLEIVGGVLEIYSALGPRTLPVDLDSRSLDDVEALIVAVRVLSEVKSISFEFQLGSTYVGCIDNGIIDRVLHEGLLIPWRENLKRKT
ncbi:hypothetical protein HX787_15090 [Pseudomonas tolaasii]|uniref:Uncharacterized protein n=1 Tax=Pseudomonas tolaasii TaxID=29442 RepID=A0A7Y8ARF8_PSETO|nr:hypothetical protein [Pseudomonas tolaasii]ARB28866.1 hypothetical protein B5P22_16730 [Pseudomonas tolaasii]KAB0468610.1 hypothetical protein F7R12_23710 [Pseudomonas tolaasii]MBW1250152.1 hypothetical protein [Pseudomonas tolaasii]MBW4791830.1 hypothetical protein [Pseudomonas tolaasii]MBY8941388.1 hypothetical protein [Pseudomonas tolaasii]